MYVVHLPFVRAQKSLHMTSHALYCVYVGACTLVNEASAVVNGAVRVTFRVEIPARSPAMTDDRSAGFDSCIYNVHQSVCPERELETFYRTRTQHCQTSTAS
jgi:hypothetical protein